MKQPEGFSVKGKKELVYKLKKSLYGLNQSPRMWYQKFDTYIQGLGFVRSNVDHCVYYKQVGNDFIYVVLYVVGWKQHGCYQGGKNAAILKVRHEGSRCCKFDLGDGDQKKSCR